MSEPMYAWTCEQWGHRDKCTIGNCDCSCHAQCEACQHVDFAHASHEGCAYGGCDCKRVNYGYGWLKPVGAPSSTDSVLRRLGAELQEMCVESLGKMNRARTVENIAKYRAMADAYGNAAELLWRRAREIPEADLGQ